MERTIAALITRIDVAGAAKAEDVVAIEEPLEIRVGDAPVSITMRTPGEDFALAAGFLLTEGILRDAEEIDAIRHWGSANVVRVALRAGVRVDLQRLKRHFYSASSCGVCGKASIDAVRINAPRIESALRVEPSLVARLPELLRAQQTTFDMTGGLHGAALFTADGALVRAAEDVGRHNAVDKVIGGEWLEGHALDERILVISGRAAFEIVQKAAVARIPVVVAVGAPSSLAVELAREVNLTLLGFVREGRCNVYWGEERVRAPLTPRG